jgi:hypothetical protein
MKVLGIDSDTPKTVVFHNVITHKIITAAQNLNAKPSGSRYNIALGDIVIRQDDSKSRHVEISLLRIRLSEAPKIKQPPSTIIAESNVGNHKCFTRRKAWSGKCTEREYTDDQRAYRKPFIPTPE